jgi:SAM-dependent methyltransferase
MGRSRHDNNHEGSVSRREVLWRVYRAAVQANETAVLQAMPPRPGGVLLDVGCADGRFSERVARQVGAGTTVGLELRDDLVALARTRIEDPRRADLNEPWPVETSSIDALHSNQVIEHLVRTDHFMREIRRVLKPDGYAVVSTNNLASWHNIVSLTLGLQPPPCHVSDETVIGNPLSPGEGYAGDLGFMHLRLFTGRALAGLAVLHGLRVDYAGGAGYYPFTRGGALLARLDGRHAAFLVQRYGVGDPRL